MMEDDEEYFGDPSKVEEFLWHLQNPPVDWAEKITNKEADLLRAYFERGRKKKNELN